MNILVIGNGFDLEHDLPTSYRAFLEFCEKVRKIFTYDIVNSNEYYEANLKNWYMNDTIKNLLLSAFEESSVGEIPQEDGTISYVVTTSNHLLNELYSHIDNNAWLQYFLNCPSYIGENWIDFESEIAQVIRALDAGRFQVESGGSANNVEPNEKRLLIAIRNVSNTTIQDIFKDVRTIDEFTNYLSKELERLIRALEIYIAGFVQNIEISKKSTDIENLNPDFVLSFNYSNTYERVYGNGREIKYNYIHGKADINKNIKTCNMVLGIDEYLDDDRKDTDLEFLSFKKYFQRVYKQTENQYLNWGDKIKKDSAEYNRKLELAYTGKPDPLRRTPGQNHYYSISAIHRPKHTLYIFGHSLDVTDKDVLKLFICNDNVQTKIFYHRKNEDDKRSLGKLIRNLVKIIGQEELIRRTGGSTRTIEFLPQSIPESEKP